MKRTTIVIASILAFALGAHAQDFKKVVDIVAEMETSLRNMIAKEESQRKAEVATLKSQVDDLRTSFAQALPANASRPGEPQHENVEMLAQRIEAMENKVGENSHSTEVAALTTQLSGLLVELRKSIDDSKVGQAAVMKPEKTFSITGQIRHRSEIDGKSFTPESKAIWFNLLRSRVNVVFKPIEDVSVFVQMQDARLFGNGNPTLAQGTMDGGAKAIDFHQAHFSVSKLFGTPISVKVGRQELVYSNERLIGSVGWSNIGRTFDAAMISYTRENVSVDVFTSKLVGSQTSSVSENFRGIYSTLRFLQPHLIDAFVLVDDNTDQVRRGVDAGTSKLARYTAGTYLRGKPNPIDYEFELAYQVGKIALNDTSARASIGAYLVSGSFGYTLDPENKLRAGILYTRLSGDSNPKDNTVQTFNTLFATNHKFYGYMDYFPSVLPSQGLQDFSLFAGINLLSNFSLSIDLHHFALERAATLTDINGNKVEKKTLGQEIDLTSNVKYNANFSFIAGASAFIPDDVMRSVKGDAASYWFYLMTLVNF